MITSPKNFNTSYHFNKLFRWNNFLKYNLPNCIFKEFPKPKFLAFLSFSTGCIVTVSRWVKVELIWKSGFKTMNYRFLNCVSSVISSYKFTIIVMDEFPKIDEC